MMKDGAGRRGDAYEEEKEEANLRPTKLRKVEHKAPKAKSVTKMNHIQHIR